MKKTQFIDLITIIKKNIVAFVSICLFVMLAIGLFLGISYSGDATLKIADKITANNYHDLNILYPYGFSDEDINKIKSINSSYKAEGYYFTYEYLKVDGGYDQISIEQVNDEIDTLYDIEGNIPTTIGEIAVEKTFASKLGIKIGDTITFENNSSDNLELINKALDFDTTSDDLDSLMEEEVGKGYLSTYTFKVTALVRKPTVMTKIKNMYGVSTTNGLGIDGYMYISEDSFKKEAFTGYPGLLIKDETLSSYPIFQDEYKEGLSTLQSAVESTISSITNNKNTLVIDSIDNIINKGDEDLADGKKQIEDGQDRLLTSEKQIEDAQIKINNGNKQISDGQAKINSAERNIINSEKQISDNENLLNEASNKIEDGKKQIADAESQISDGEAQIKENEEKISLAQQAIEYAEQYLVDYNTKFTKSDEVVDSLREDRNNIDNLSKEELVSLMKKFVDGTYDLLNDQGNDYTKLAKYKVVDEEKYYEKIANIPSTKGGSYIGKYLEEHEDVCNNFYYDVADEEPVGEEYIGYTKTVEEVLSKEEKNEDDFDDIGLSITMIDMYNSPDEDTESTTKTIILDTILEDYYSNSNEDTLRNTINYLFDQYDDYKKELDVVNNSLDKAKKELEDSKATLAEYKQKLEDGKQELANKKKELEDGINAYNDGKNKLDDAKNQLASGKSKLNESKNELNSAKNRLNNAKSELNSAKDKLASGKQELEDAKKEYESSKISLDDFKEKRESIKTYDATYSTGLDNPGIHSIRAISGIINKIKYTMAGLFVVIGLLVCYFSILRMVNEHIKLIGTKKALGFHTAEITRTYILFTGISTIIGCILGVLLGSLVIQRIIMKSVIDALTYNGMLTSFKVSDAIIMCVLEIILLLLITYGATRFILKENAVVLLAGPKPPAGKARFYEKFRLWNKLSLFNKTIVNNCISDKRRVLGTLIGVCGCTALVVTALTLNNSLTKNFNKQFGELFHFDSIVYYTSENSKEEINEILDKYSVPKANALKTYTIIKDDNGGSLYSFLIVPEDLDEFKNLVDMEPLTNKDSDPYSGLWITYAYKNIYKDINDEFEFITLSGANARVKASGYFGYYLTVAQMFMDKESYMEANNGQYSTNAILIDTSNIDVDNLKSELENVDGYLQLEDFKGDHEVAFDITRNLAEAIVGAYVALSFAMAVLVLLNLYTMFVTEKKKELITLMINGYSLKDAKKYISKDTVLLTIVGIILGMILGTVFGFISIDTFNNYSCYVFKEVDVAACAIGALNSAMLSFIMCKIALLRVDKFKMADINN